jgi:hypothetical protein
MTPQLTVHQMVVQASHVRRLQEAERAYRINEALGAPQGIAAGPAVARQAVGSALILVGEWLRGKPSVAAPLGAPSLVR